MLLEGHWVCEMKSMKCGAESAYYGTYYTGTYANEQVVYNGNTSQKQTAIFICIEFTKF